jgi:hypothetical protein
VIGDGDQIRLTVRAEGPGPPAAIRLRHLLKSMLRGYGLRVVSIEGMPAESVAEVPQRPSVLQRAVKK